MNAFDSLFIIFMLLKALNVMLYSTLFAKKQFIVGLAIISFLAGM